MEYKFIIGCSLLLAIVSLSIGCGYFDNDKVEYQKEITRNIIIQKQENDNSNNLIFKETNDVSAVIVDDCVKIYYDSVAERIYVETYQNKVDRNYWQVDILNPEAKYVSEATKKTEITKNFFEENTKNITNKWEFEK